MNTKFNEGEWIPHSGGECPIPWAKVGEYQVKNTLGEVMRYVPLQCRDELGAWMWVSAYRLTDRWIPVIDGKCPIVASAGQWEKRLSNGVSVVDQFPTFIGYALDQAIVAVRLVKSKQTIQENINAARESVKQRPEWMKDKVFETEANNIVAISLVKSMPDELKEGLRKASEKVELMREENAKQRPKRDMEHKYVYEIGITPEKQLQRVLSVMAVNRYKAAHPDPIPFRPLGQDGIEAAIFASLCEEMKR